LALSSLLFADFRHNNYGRFLIVLADIEPCQVPGLFRNEYVMLLFPVGGAALIPAM